MCFCTHCCCVTITVVRERHVERCGPAVGSTGASDKAYYANILKELDTEDKVTHVYMWDVHHVNMVIWMCAVCVCVYAFVSVCSRSYFCG